MKSAILATTGLHFILRIRNQRMRKLKFILLFISVLFISETSFAQLNPIKQFSEDPIAFLGEIKTMFEATNMDKKEIKEFI